MDNKENLNDIADDKWLEELFAAHDPDAEPVAGQSAADEQDAGELSDAELQKIIQETMAQEDWDLDEFTPNEDASPYLDEEYRDALSEDSMMQDEAYADAYEQEEDPNTPVRKVRPKKKTGYGLFALPHLASTIIWALIVVIAGISLGRLLWVCASDVLAFNRQDQKISVTITEEDDLASISKKLYDAGLIKYPELFKLYGGISNAEKKIDTGTFELNTLYDYHALVDAMRASSTKDDVEVVIPEGYSCAQIFALLEKKGVCKAADLEEYAATSQFSSYWFLEDVPKGHKYCLEGFLFPDTYEFYKNDKPQRVFSILLARFEDKFGKGMLPYIDSLNEILSKKLKKNGFSSSYIEEHRMTMYTVVTMASIIQKECAHSGEIYNISSMYYNRLTNSKKYPKLESDATLSYALGGKTKLEEADFTFDNPYNTHVYEGLTPGPISNPGLSCLLAAVRPADTNYYYFYMDNAISEHVFFATKSEMEAYIGAAR